MQGTESISVKIKHPIQLVTMYLTAVVMKSGEVHFLRDIYGEDAALERTLAIRPDAMATKRKPGKRLHQ